MGDITFTQLLPLNPETSDRTPALAAHLGNLVLCWKGTGNTTINFWSSSNGGEDFPGGPFVETVETTDAAPALAALGDILYIAWKGTGNTILNIGQVAMTFDSNGFISAFEGIVNKVELTNANFGPGDYSTDTGPALTAHIQYLFLAFKAAGNSILSLLCLTPNLEIFAPLYPYPGATPLEYTDSPPSLASHNGSLFIGWRGIPNHFLNVATVEFGPLSPGAPPPPTYFQILGWSAQKLTIFSEVSGSSVSLASVRNLLFLSWTNTSNLLCVMASDNNAGSFVHKGISVTTPSGTAPSLAWYNDHCYISWAELNSNFLRTAYTGLYGQLTDLNLQTQSGQIIQDMGRSMPGNFFALVRQQSPPAGTELDLWTRVNWELDLRWKDSNLELPHTTKTIGSLIQSSIGKPNYPGNYEVVILTGLRNAHSLEHWSYVSSSSTWTYQSTISSTATGPGSIIQSTIGSPGNPSRFEVLALEESVLVHYYSQPTSPETWIRGEIVTRSAASFGSIMQSNRNASSDLIITPGNFEVLVLVEDIGLAHYTKPNNLLGAGAWQLLDIVSKNATGPATLIQSTFGAPSGYTNFEAVVLEGSNLVHYWLNMSDPSSGWQSTAVISSNASGPGSIMQSNLWLPEQLGNFEVVVLEGSDLVFYERDNTNLTWSSGTVITSSAFG